MTLEIQSLMEVDRTLPHAELDGDENNARLTRYREQTVVSFIQTKHPLADEGSLYLANNAQTGIATAAAPTAFSAVNPFLVIYNGNAPNDDFATRTYLDYLMLLVTAPGTAGASVQFAIVKDRGNRYVSGGTELFPKPVFQAAGRATANRVFAGNLVASAPSSNAITLIGNRYMKGAIPVIGDQYTIRFGTTDVMDILSISTILFSSNHVPALILGPDESMLVYLWLPTQSAASSFAPEVSFWER